VGSDEPKTPEQVPSTPEQSSAPPSPTAEGGVQGDASTSALTPSLGTGLDRKAIERILARAAELQGQASADSADAISESQLLEIAKEVGLSSANVHQALAEERSRIELDNESGLVARVAGPSTVSASRVLTGTPDALLRTLDEWMQREECMQVQRRFTDRMVWEVRNDWVSTVRRNLHIGGRQYHLSRTTQVFGTVIAVDPTRTLVRLDADITSSRSKHVGGSAVIGGGGVVASGTLLAFGAVAHMIAAVALAVAAVPVSVAAVGIYFNLKHQQHFAIRTKVALEQVLDNLEFNNTRRSNSLFSTLASGRTPLR
jgi:hypothetical protein